MPLRIGLTRTHAGEGSSGMSISRSEMGTSALVEAPRHHGPTAFIAKYRGMLLRN
jgi:hypothetical protein